MTERNYDLRLQNNVREKYAVIRFWSEKDVKLRIKDIKFFYGKKEYDSVSLGCIAINLKSNKCQLKNIDFPQDRKYTSLNFIVQDITYQTQHAVQVPLDGSECKFTEMPYGE